jgi:hypothetical protein
VPTRFGGIAGIPVCKESFLQASIDAGKLATDKKVNSGFLRSEFPSGFTLTPLCVCFAMRTVQHFFGDDD